MTPTPSDRLLALDQFRGYTVLGMFVVNFVGSFDAIPAVLKHHHTYCSYADTIMPQFLFAVGFALRLTFVRRQRRDGTAAAYTHILWRVVALLFVALLVHGLGGGVRSWASVTNNGIWTALGHGLKRPFFQTLGHIAVTTLWLVPVVGLGGWPRLLWAVASGIGFHLLSAVWYYQWVNTDPVGIDGGPLGFLTWAIPAITGTLTCDAFFDGQTFRRDPPWQRLLAASVALMLLGYLISCVNRVTPPNGPIASWTGFFLEPPFVSPPGTKADHQAIRNLWTMSQRSGSLSYLTFSAGFSLAVFLGFWGLCDRLGFALTALNTLGANALAGYILHDMAAGVMKPFTPGDAPLWYVILATLLFLLVCYVGLRYLEKHRLYLRL